MSDDPEVKQMITRRDAMKMTAGLTAVACVAPLLIEPASEFTVDQIIKLERKLGRIKIHAFHGREWTGWSDIKFWLDTADDCKEGEVMESNLLPKIGVPWPFVTQTGTLVCVHRQAKPFGSTGWIVNCYYVRPGSNYRPWEQP